VRIVSALEIWYGPPRIFLFSISGSGPPRDFMQVIDLPKPHISSGPAVGPGVILVACIGIFVAWCIPALGAGQSNPPQSSGLIDFDIPAQPLANALVAYGAVTGLEVYYDGALAIEKRSVPLKGKFTPIAGLEMLVRDAGYVPHATGPDTFTLAAEPRATQLPVAISETLIQQYEPYFGALQQRVVEALCGVDTAHANEIIFSFSVDTVGVISHAEILGSSGDPTRDSAISAGLRGLNIGIRPPAGLPQPVTMAVYPPPAGDSAGCAQIAHKQMDN
jgi:hypothetical protein